MPHLPARDPNDVPVWLRVVPMVIGALVGVTLIGWATSTIVAGFAGVLWGLGLNSVGLTFGFLFALPRVWPGAPASTDTNDANEGGGVRLIESRPLSRTKRWRLVEVLERAK